MPYFLLKTEPSEYSFEMLRRDGACVWEGVSNATALIHLRSMKKGDQAFIYHTGDEKAIVGLATVTKAAYEDPKKPGRNDRDEPKFAVVDLKPGKSAKKSVTLAEIKADARFAKFPLVTQGRLSVMPVAEDLAKALLGMSGLGGA